MKTNIIKSKSTSELPQTDTAETKPALLTAHTAPEADSASAKAPEVQNVSEPTEAERIHLIPLDRIRPASFNPRSRYNEDSIAELAHSIARYGLLQPIGLRPVADGYEIIFGERRYRAVSLLGHSVIKAYIRQVADAEGRAVATIENIQRENMPPMDEARAFDADRAGNGGDIQAIATKYGKSANYIYDRLCLLQLIPEIADLVQVGILPIAMGKALARFDKKLQKDIYNDHLREGAPWNWRDLSVKEFVTQVNRVYTNDLNRYKFDKEDCKACANNASNYELFAEHDDCGLCTNEACLKAKNEAYLSGRAESLLKANPRITLCQRNYGDNEQVIGKLTAAGHACKNIGYENLTEVPQEPAKPERDSYKDEAAYLTAQQEYEKAKAKYDKAKQQLDARCARGEIRYYVRVQDNDAGLVYVEQARRVSTEENFLLRMQEKKKRNEEIEREKVLADTQKLVRHGKIPTTDFTAFEEKTLYFYLLESLPKEYYPTVGCAGADYLTAEQKQKITENLTAEQKAIICRAFLSEHLSRSYGSVETAMLAKYAEIHYPKERGIICAKYEEERTNRNARIDERIAEYERQKKAAAPKAKIKSVDSVTQATAAAATKGATDAKAKPDKSIPTPKSLTKPAKKTTPVKQKSAFHKVA